MQVLRALLRGEEVEWEGGAIRMSIPKATGIATDRGALCDTAAGPKGLAVAREVGDGVFGAVMPLGGFSWSIALTLGTVLEGEDPASARALGAAGHAAAAMFDAALEQGRLDVVPRGKEWAAAYDAVPARVRHLALHDKHLIAINDRDRPFVTGEDAR